VQARVLREGGVVTGLRMESLILGIEGDGGTLHKPCSQPHLTPWASPTQPLKANCYLKVIVPEEAKWALLWSLSISFKIFYTFGLTIIFFTSKY
jgi:hypothetical protein